MSGDKNNENIEVVMSKKEFPLFQAFMRHRERFEIMLNNGVFELDHGKATINMHEGHIQTILVEERRYQYTPPPRSTLGIGPI